VPSISTHRNNGPPPLRVPTGTPHEPRVQSKHSEQTRAIHLSVIISLFVMRRHEPSAEWPSIPNDYNNLAAWDDGLGVGTEVLRCLYNPRRSAVGCWGAVVQ
jgi:hypothetical protein